MPEERAESFVEHLNVFRNSRRPAVQTDALTLSYADLIDLVDDTATQLRAVGLEPGDRVLVMMPNCVEHIVAVLAAISVAAIAVPLDPDAGSARQDDVVRQTTPRFCLTCVSMAAPSALQTISLRIDPDTATAYCSMEGAATGQMPMTEQQQQIAFIRFTSGSTGQAKGVVITHTHQLWIARTLSKCFGLDSEHRELLLVSIALSGGWQRVAATLFGGGCVILAGKPLSVGDMLDMLQNYRATGFFTPPPLVRMLLASPSSKIRAALKHCRSIEIGSAVIQADELQTLMALGPNARVYVHYGLTECSRAVVLDTANHPDKLATVGRPAPGVEIRIVDQEGQPLPGEQNGQILVRGPQLTSGYWQRPDLNRQRFVEGWLLTGDYGFIDEAGFLTLRGRHDDLINCGGHCYFPDEAEQALGAPAEVVQYLIAGIPDPRGVLQQVPWAFVVPVNADAWLPADFLALARTRLPAHMVPRQVVVVPRLPLTPSGKPDRRETVKLYGPSQ